MKIFERVAALRAWRGEQPSVGFVPTLGALHAGHASLIERAKTENARTVVSIFLNPTQFDDPKDLDRYPTPLQSDIELLARLKVDALFLPSKSELYPDGFRFRIAETELSQRFCGAHRPRHFEGVLTVVMKLFQSVQPTRAYFGEKDYQQLRLIEGMVEAFFLPIEIRRCETVRDSDGVALSSRNVHLSAAARQTAARFASALRSDQPLEAVESQLNAEGMSVEYLERFEGRRLAAVRIDGVRLIDNVKENHR